MQAIRLAVGILGVLDMLQFGGTLVLLGMYWSAAIKQHAMLGNAVLIFIILVSLMLIAAAGLVDASISKSRIKSMRYCHLWLCLSITILLEQIIVAYFLFLFFGVSTYSMMYMLELLFRAIAIILVIQFLKTLECEIFSPKSDRGPTAAAKVPQNQFA